MFIKAISFSHKGLLLKENNMLSLRAYSFHLVVAPLRRVSRREDGPYCSEFALLIQIHVITYNG